MFIVAALCIVALFVFFYHYERNGNPWAIGDTAERLIWAFFFALSHPILSFIHGAPAIRWIAAYLFAAQFVAMLIPHAFAQNAGHRTQTWESMTPLPLWGTLTVPKWWPGYPVTFIWASTIEKLFTLQDFFGMMCVGALRGAIVFLPTIALGASWTGAVTATAITALWQPASYWLGYKVPWSIWTNAAKSSTWGEFFVPIGWAVALVVSILC